MPLTSIQINHIQPQAKDYWLSDEKGLRLLVKVNGAKYWRLKYRFGGKQKTLALGVYPEVSLKEARIARDDARLSIRQGIDPSRQKQLVKRQRMYDEQTRFSVLALAWWEHQKDVWTEKHAQKVWSRLRDNCFRDLDVRPMESVTPQDIIYVVKHIESRNALDVASRVLQDIRRVFRYGVQQGILSHNPATELSGVIKPRKSQHRASLPAGELGQFLRDLDGYPETGRLVTKLAIELLVLTFVRPGELRGARWDELDFEKALWRIPAERMKMGSEHLVPLSRQALSVIEELAPITRQYDLLFPSERKRHEPMSDNTMRKAMFTLGYDGNTRGKSRATPHGFRANASSILNEQGFNPDAIERQLSHMERNNVRAAYTHHARYLDERATMMQWWADYLDEARGI